MAIHRTKEKTQNEREASWGLERRELGGGRGAIAMVDGILRRRDAYTFRK